MHENFKVCFSASWLGTKVNLARCAGPTGFVPGLLVLHCYCSAETQTLLPSPVLRSTAPVPCAVLVTTEPCRVLWLRANVSVTACSFWCHKLQAVCLVFLPDFESVNTTLAVCSGCWGQCCSRLALATRGSASVFISYGFTEWTAWLHRWQIIGRVEKSKECSPAHNSLLKNAHHALSFASQSPWKKMCIPCMFAIHVGQHIIHRACVLSITHILHWLLLKLSPEPCKCGYGLSIHPDFLVVMIPSTDLFLRFSFHELLANLGPIAL